MFSERGGALLTAYGVNVVYHYAPLHYLPFIARERALLSKSRLRASGFSEEHFRSTSRRADVDRGFGEYVHLTVTHLPPILLAKLRGGFPHAELAVPASTIETQGFHLCRYNIAKSRMLRRADGGGFPESQQNGRYYAGKRLPMAQTPSECEALLSANIGRNMIEVLVREELRLPRDLEVTLFHADDVDMVSALIGRVGVKWRLVQSEEGYRPKSHQVTRVREFIKHALDDPMWRGDGLEFDRV